MLAIMITFATSDKVYRFIHFNVVHSQALSLAIRLPCVCYSVWDSKHRRRKDVKCGLVCCTSWYDRAVRVAPCTMQRACRVTPCVYVRALHLGAVLRWLLVAHSSPYFSHGEGFSTAELPSIC